MKNQTQIKAEIKKLNETMRESRVLLSASGNDTLKNYYKKNILIQQEKRNILIWVLNN